MRKALIFDRVEPGAIIIRCGLIAACFLYGHKCPRILFREDVTWVLYRNVRFPNLAEIVGVRMTLLKLFIWFVAPVVVPWNGHITCAWNVVPTRVGRFCQFQKIRIKNGRFRMVFLTKVARLQRCKSLNRWRIAALPFCNFLFFQLRSW